VQASDSAQVSIDDVPPNATVVKSLGSIACADVNYHVKVTNIDMGDANITLTALSDDGFLSLTSVHDKVLGTTCGVATGALGLGTLSSLPGAGALPATIAKNGVYECDFQAHFCGGSHQNTVTGTIHDNDNPATDVLKPSNSLTVYVNASTTPPGP